MLTNKDNEFDIEFTNFIDLVKYDKNIVDEDEIYVLADACRGEWGIRVDHLYIDRLVPSMKPITSYRHNQEYDTWTQDNIYLYKDKWLIRYVRDITYIDESARKILSKVSIGKIDDIASIMFKWDSFEQVVTTCKALYGDKWGEKLIEFADK